MIATGCGEADAFQIRTSLDTSGLAGLLLREARNANLVRVANEHGRFLAHLWVRQFRGMLR
jgi:hypothetical protein